MKKIQPEPEEPTNPKTLPKQKSSLSLSPSSFKLSTCIYLIAALLLLFFLFQIQALKNPFPSSSSSWSFIQQWRETFLNPHQNPNCSLLLTTLLSRLRQSVTFLPLKDLRFATSAMDGHTWFMSSLNDTSDDDPSDSEHLLFPSTSSSGRLLCLTGHHPSDGGRNSYALAWPDSLPTGATLLSGLTFVSDTYYDYHNIWHGLSAVFPFVGWHLRNGKCEVPARWVLYHWGELRVGMGPWVGALMWATFGEKVHGDGLDRAGPTCFERALVFRHNLGSMGREKRMEVFDVLRCKARAYCNVSRGTLGGVIGLTLLLRTGPRSFKNESGVVRIFERVCGKVDGCQLTVARSDNLSFCDQVKLMTETDILASPHGAQLTNMFMMERNSSVMEFYPRGWLKLAGVGQYVYKWEASWSGMRHQGAWRDPEEGGDCPNPQDRGNCFSFYKPGKIGHNETFLVGWIADVLNQEKIRRSQQASSMRLGEGHHYVKPSNCPCS